MKGINFIEPLFHASVEGRKTQTRRIIKSRTGFFNVESKNDIVTDIWQCDANGWNGDNLIPVKPRYSPGETVYLKEPYKINENSTRVLDVNDIAVWVNYKFGGCELAKSIFMDDYSKVITQQKKSKSGWCNKLFMPEWAARYFTLIKDVRAERLQEITDEDCIKEGIREYLLDPEEAFTHIKEFSNPFRGGFISPVDAYADLIDKISGRGTWDSNPWVWRVEYGMIDKKTGGKL